MVQLLESQTEHVLVNAVNALRVLCEGNCSNQTAVAQSGAVEILIPLLGRCATLASCYFAFPHFPYYILYLFNN